MSAYSVTVELRVTARAVAPSPRRSPERAARRYAAQTSSIALASCYHLDDQFTAMRLATKLSVLALSTTGVLAHLHEQERLSIELDELVKLQTEGGNLGNGVGEDVKKPSRWLEKYGPQYDQPFSGPLSFSHLPYHTCLEQEALDYDIAIIGMPFDTGECTSMRPLEDGLRD